MTEMMARGWENCPHLKGLKAATIWDELDLDRWTWELPRSTPGPYVAEHIPKPLIADWIKKWKPIINDALEKAEEPSEQEMVLAYHEKMGFTVSDQPTTLSQEQVTDRSDILQEEVDELREALENEDLVGIADGICDSIYVLKGTAVACGINIDPLFKEVHRSNMTKTPPPTSTGKALKGESYSPPDLTSLLKEQIVIEEE